MIKEKKYNNYIEILNEIFSKRVSKNPQYSLAAFSRDAGFKSYFLSDVMLKRYKLSVKRAPEVADNLKMPKHIKQLFVLFVESENGRTLKSRRDAKKKISEIEFQKFNVSKIDSNQFSLMKDWYYLAVVELSQGKGFKKCPEWVATKLGIEIEEAVVCLNRLSELGLFDKVNSGAPEKILFKILGAKRSLDIRSYHRQVIEKALVSLEKDDTATRYFFTQNHLLSKKEYEYFSKKIHETVNSLFSELKLERSKKNNESESKRLYAFSAQMFPLDRVV